MKQDNPSKDLPHVQFNGDGTTTVELKLKNAFGLFKVTIEAPSYGGEQYLHHSAQVTGRREAIEKALEENGVYLNIHNLGNSAFHSVIEPLMNGQFHAQNCNVKVLKDIFAKVKESVDALQNKMTSTQNKKDDDVKKVARHSKIKPF